MWLDCTYQFAYLLLLPWHCTFACIIQIKCQFRCVISSFGCHKWNTKHTSHKHRALITLSAMVLYAKTASTNIKNPMLLAQNSSWLVHTVHKSTAGTRHSHQPNGGISVRQMPNVDERKFRRRCRIDSVDWYKIDGHNFLKYVRLWSGEIIV